MAELLLDISIGLTICYAFVNGFHDGPNVVATLICSKSMHPVRALAVAATSEFLGALILGTAVAQTMAGSIFKVELLDALSPQHIYSIAIGAVLAAIVWNFVTWLLGLPSSSSHALVGGLVGAGVTAIGAKGIAVDTLVEKVFLPLFCAPIAGIICGFFVFHFIRQAFSGAHRSVGLLFVFLQKPSMIFLSASHGSNDAQKSMGIIAFVLLAGAFPKSEAVSIPHWAMIACAAALAIGLTTGGWRIVKTVGYGICRLEPVHSFASQVTAASVILGSSLLGWPVSTAQVVASSVMGVGASRRLSGVRWTAAANIAYAWLLTVPASGCMGAFVYWVLARTLTN